MFRVNCLGSRRGPYEARRDIQVRRLRFSDWAFTRRAPWVSRRGNRHRNIWLVSDFQNAARPSSLAARFGCRFRKLILILFVTTYLIELSDAWCFPDCVTY